MEMHIDGIRAGERVVLLDDFARNRRDFCCRGCFSSVRPAGIARSQFLIELQFLHGRNLLDQRQSRRSEVLIFCGQTTTRAPRQSRDQSLGAWRDLAFEFQL